MGVSDERYWELVAERRLAVADLLDGLDADQWERPSLCEGWTVRDVAAHLAMSPDVTFRSMLLPAVRARGNVLAVSAEMARRHARRPPSELVAQLRGNADNRHMALGLDQRNCLFDAAVHGHDVAVPLALPYVIPVEIARRSLERVWSMGFPFRARRRLGNIRMRATDSDWVSGKGPEVVGSTESLLLLATGRTAVAVPSLTGSGVDVVRRR